VEKSDLAASEREQRESGKDRVIAVIGRSGDRKPRSFV